MRSVFYVCPLAIVHLPTISHPMISFFLLTSSDKIITISRKQFWSNPPLTAVMSIKRRYLDMLYFQMQFLANDACGEK